MHELECAHHGSSAAVLAYSAPSSGGEAPGVNGSGVEGSGVIETILLFILLV